MLKIYLKEGIIIAKVNPRKRTKEQFQYLLDEKFGPIYEVTGEYVDSQTKVGLLCKVCGNIFYKVPNKMTSCGEGCYFCSKKNWHKTTESFQKELDNRFPNTYEVLTEYVKARKPLLVKRIPCGHIYKVSPDNLLRGKGCALCTIRQSHYMDIVEDYFKKHNIIFEKEKRFDDCRNIRVLPFDYYIPDKNLCIEVDGEFHYPHVTYEKSDQTLKGASQQEAVHERNLIKTAYCEQNGIDLLRLPYFEEKNFEKILDDKFNANTEINEEISQGSSSL